MFTVKFGFCTVLSIVLIADGVSAAEPIQQHNSTALWFENWIGLSNASLTVATPDGTIIQIFAADGTPVFELAGDEIDDGVYHYELTAATDETIEQVNPVDNGRGDAETNVSTKPFYSSGHFTVSRGVIITPDDIAEEG